MREAFEENQVWVGATAYLGYQEVHRPGRAPYAQVRPDRGVRAAGYQAVRDCLVTGYERLIEAMQLPDPDDRHVFAAAIKSCAQVIVTTNLKDFPEAELRP